MKTKSEKVRHRGKKATRKIDKKSMLVGNLKNPFRFKKALSIAFACKKIKKPISYQTISRSIGISSGLADPQGSTRSGPTRSGFTLHKSSLLYSQPVPTHSSSGVIGRHPKVPLARCVD